MAAVLNSGALLAALEAGAAPQAAVVLPAPADGTGQQQAWGLKLISGSPGSDPDAITYQGDLLDDTAASDWRQAWVAWVHHRIASTWPSIRSQTSDAILGSEMPGKSIRSH